MHTLREAINHTNDGIASRLCHTTSLAGQVYDLLHRAGYLALRDVTCEVHEGVALLNGRLTTHHLKQLAQELTSKVDGIRCVVNRIEVTTSRPSQSSNASRFGANTSCFDYSIES